MMIAKSEHIHVFFCRIFDFGKCIDYEKAYNICMSNLCIVMIRKAGAVCSGFIFLDIKGGSYDDQSNKYEEKK